jgi:N-acetylneuraminic acid mutarotase
MWQPMKIQPALIHLSRHTSNLYENELFIYGGYRKTETETDVEENDLMFQVSLETGKYLSTTVPINGRCGHTACIYKDSLFIFGKLKKLKTFSGGLTLISYLNDLHEYNFKTKKWTHRKYFGYVERRFAHSAAIINNKMVIFGGITDGNRIDEDYQILNDIFEYNFEEDTFIECVTPSLKITPICGQAAISFEEEIYLFGGLLGKNKRSNEVYKLKKSGKYYQYETLPKSGNIPCDRAGSTMVEINSDLYITGGYDGIHALDDIYQYSIKSQKWKRLDFVLPLGLRLHSANLIKTKESFNLIVFGGSGSEDEIFNQFFQIYLKPVKFLSNLLENDNFIDVLVQFQK